MAIHSSKVTKTLCVLVGIILIGPTPYTRTRDQLPAPTAQAGQQPRGRYLRHRRLSLRERGALEVAS
jgi:hypothetical protein